MARRIHAAAFLLAALPLSGCIAFSSEVPEIAGDRQPAVVSSASMAIQVAFKHVRAGGAEVPQVRPEVAKTVLDASKSLFPRAALGTSGSDYEVSFTVTERERGATWNAIVTGITLFLFPLFTGTEVTTEATVYDAQGQQVGTARGFASSRMVVWLLFFVPINTGAVDETVPNSVRGCLDMLAKLPCWDRQGRQPADPRPPR